MHIAVKKEVRPHAEVSLLGVIPAKAVEVFYEKALAAATKAVAIPGFRKGHVPKERVVEEIGENFLWKDAAERALKDELEEIMKSEDVAPIAPLSLSLSSVEAGKDVSFEIIAVIAPSVSIGDYKKVANDALDALPAEDKEAEEAAATRAFRTQVRAITKIQKSEEVKESGAKENEAPDAKAAEEMNRADEPLSDDEAKGAGFENGKAVEHFIEGEATKAVADRLMQKRRAAVAGALISAAQTAIPRVLINEETRALLETFKRDVASQGLQWSDYLKRSGKGEEAVTQDLAPNAEKRIALDLIFAHIIREEKLELSEEDKKKEEEFAHRLVKQGVPHDRAHSYAREQFLREKVWEVLGVKANSLS